MIAQLYVIFYQFIRYEKQEICKNLKGHPPAATGKCPKNRPLWFYLSLKS